MRGELAAGFAEPAVARVGPPTVSVVVTTYRRPEVLSRCLAGVRLQARPADELIVVVHALDQSSVRVVELLMPDWPAVRCVRVDRHGSVAALNCGLAAATGSIVAIIDDDAVPELDWLERIERTFNADAWIAAVGGRDVIVIDGQVLGAPKRRWHVGVATAPDVGRIQWFGRMIANHHLGSGSPRDVDVLKGANMSFRRKTVVGHGFDERLHGIGAIVHSELSICLPLRRRGLRIVYDPAIVVWHYPAPRPHGDARGEAVFSTSHNEALAILDYFGLARRLVFMVWALAIGSTDAPGLAVTTRDMLSGRPRSLLRFRAAQRGRRAALHTRQTRRSIPPPLAHVATVPETAPSHVSHGRS